MFLIFTDAHTKKPILVNSDHIRTATEVEGHNRVTLAMDPWDGGVFIRT